LPHIVLPRCATYAASHAHNAHAAPLRCAALLAAHHRIIAHALRQCIGVSHARTIALLHRMVRRNGYQFDNAL